MNLAERLRRDARRLVGDPEASALHRCLAEHLTDPNLDITFLANVCGAPREVRDRLAAVVGPLRAYITELRMIRAKRAVCETKTPIRELGKRLGIPVPRTFRRAFYKAYGQSPDTMRKAAQAPAAPDPEEVAAEVAETLREAGDPGLAPAARDAHRRRRAALELLEPEEIAELRVELRRSYPCLDEADRPGDAPDEPADTPEGRTPDPVLLRPTHDHLEKVAANAVFTSLLDLPDPDLRHALLEGVRMGNPTAFLELRWICGQIIQYDAGRARMMAELAVEAIDPHREVMGDEGDDWKAAAWAHLALVCLATGDGGAADRALDFAWEEVGDRDMRPWAELEVRRVEGRLRMHQRRREQAEDALDRAVELGRGLPTRTPDRAQAVLERLELATSLGDSEAGFHLAGELEELIDGYDEAPPLWRGFVAYHRGMAHAAAGDDPCAEQWLRQAGDHVIPETERLGALPSHDNAVVLHRGLLGTFVVHQLARICQRTGRLEGSEDLFGLAADRYRHFASPILEVTAEAEQAVVCALLGRGDEARRLASASARFLDDLPLHRQAWTAARRLRAFAERGLNDPTDELQKLAADLSRDLDVVRWEITGSQALDAARARRERP